MSDNFEGIKLNTPEDYSFFGKTIGERLRNPNFQASRRQAFLKAYLEEIKPFCSYKCYQQIEKSINEIAQQKDNDRKEAKKLEKLKDNRKQKNLVSAKEIGRVNKYGVQEDDYDLDDYSDEEEDYQEQEIPK